MKRTIRISLRPLKNLVSVSEMRTTQLITIITDDIDKEKFAEVMKAYSKKKKN